MKRLRLLLGARDIAKDESGSVLVEFALVLSLFTMTAFVVVEVIGATANNQLAATTSRYGNVATNNIPTGYNANSYE